MFFSNQEDPNHLFEVFSLNHILPLLIIIIGIVFIYLFQDKLRHSIHEKKIRYSLAIFAISLEVSFQIWQAVHGEWEFAESLPLHLCRLTNYLGIYVMFTKDKRVFEIAYFWSLAGFVSLLFPDMLFGPTRYRYYHYMFSHMLFFFNFMYLLFVSQIKLNFQSFKKSFIILFLLATVVIVPINNIFDANYMYLLTPEDTPFSIFWGHGYFLYLVGCIGLTMIIMVLWYLPIHFYNKRSR